MGGALKTLFCKVLILFSRRRRRSSSEAPSPPHISPSSYDLPASEIDEIQAWRQSVELPEDLVCEIISHVNDIKDLLSCSKTCHLWRNLTLPRLHYSLTTFLGKGRRQWPKPLQGLHELSLLGFVKRFGIRFFERSDPQFTFGRFDKEHNLPYFSALKNLRELRIDNLLLSSFMPNVEECFGHLAPTLQSLALSAPEASCRQVLYFVGTFKNLRDLKILRFTPTREYETTTSLPLSPLSQPPRLDGWLTLVQCEGEEFVDEMVTLYGGLRFRRVYLFYVQYTKRVLDECVETLETLQLGPDMDDCSENFFGMKGKG